MTNIVRFMSLNRFTRTYDNRSRLTDIETLNSVGQEISSFSYTLDGVGNRTQVVEHDGRTVNYAYDSVNRLLQEKISPENRTIDYTYDLVGNRLSRNDSVLGLTTYDYDANDRLTQMLSAGVTTQFTYDNNGSMLSRDNVRETVTYDWINDGENRLVGVNSTDAGGNQSVNYVYDAQGNRVTSIGDGVRTNYLVTPGGLSQVLAEYDSNGLVTTDYTYGLGLVRSVEGGSESFYHTDGLGSVRMLTDTTGLVSDRNSYDAYGMSLSNSDGSYQFAGERRDAETELDYLRARYYDPELGRFISKDAFAGFLNDPMSQHDYQYAHGNPVNNTDPTGYFTLSEVVTGISFGAILVSVSSSLGYVGGQYANGGSISGDEALVMFDQWVAGYAHGVEGGITTAIRREDYGEVQEGDHGFLWNMGNLAGISTSFILGFKLPAALAGQMGATKWGTTFATGIAAAGEGYGIYEAGMGLADGQWDYTDVFNLLSLAPYAEIAVAGVANSLGTMRAANRAAGGVADDVGRAAGSVDDMLRSSQKTQMATDLPNPSACFVAGTEILTPEGEKDIEDIKVGDWVIADNPTTPGEIEKRQVLQTFVRETDVLVDLYVDGEVISTTEEHPFWVPDKGWVEAGDLQVGDLFQTEDGVIIDIDWIGKREGDFEVYNFEVEDFHTYFISDLEVLVHNADCKQGGKYTELTLPDKVIAEQGEIKIVHNYRSNDHSPAHVHITGGGPETRIKINGETMPGDPSPTNKQRKVIDENFPLIRNRLRKIIRWLKYNDLDE